MKKHKIPSLLLALLVMMSAVIMPVCASAAEADYSLTVQFTSTEKGVIPGSEFKIYKAMDMEGVLTEAFANYGIDVGDLYDEETDLGALADTLAAYAIRDDLEAVQTVMTNEVGLARFDGLESGIYLAVGTNVTIDNVIYIPKPFLVRVPYAVEGAGVVTDVVATVKYDRYEIIENIERSVKKVWKDNNYDGRPEEITVQLLKDGDIYEEVTLNEENDWQYTWENLDPSSDWKVTEADVPEGYGVQIVLNETTFTVTNTFDGDVEGSGNKTPSGTDTDNDKSTGTTDTKLPQTGQLWWPVPIMFAIGAIILLAGIVVSKLGNDEKEA